MLSRTLSSTGESTASLCNHQNSGQCARLQDHLLGNSAVLNLQFSLTFLHCIKFSFEFSDKFYPLYRMHWALWVSLCNACVPTMSYYNGISSTISPFIPLVTRKLFPLYFPCLIVFKLHCILFPSVFMFTKLNINHILPDACKFYWNFKVYSYYTRYIHGKVYIMIIIQ